MRRQRSVPLLCAGIVAVLAVMVAPASAQEVPEFSPPDVEPSAEEIAYYESVLSCPEIDNHSVTTNGVSVQTFGFSFGCQYRVIEPAAPAGSLSLRWSRPTNHGDCDVAPAASSQRTGVVNGSDRDPARSAAVLYTLNDNDDEAPFVTAAEALLTQALPLAPGCPEQPIEISCPTLLGYDAPDVRQAEGGSRYSARCNYFGEGQPNVELVGIWTVTALSATDSQTWLCSEPERFIQGEGQVRIDGQAVLVRSSISSLTSVDTAPVIAASRAIAAQLAAQAQSCDGVELVAFDSIFSPIPPYLADAFRPELTLATASPPTVDAPAAATSTGETATGETTTDADPSSSAATPATTGGEGASGTGMSLLRIASIVMLVVSILGLILTFVLIQRPSRVRLRFDVIKIVAIVAVGVSSALVFSRAAPMVAIAGAVAIGGLLGVLQGRNLTVSQREKGIYAQRSSLAIVAFAAGIVVTQVAGLAQRTGAVDVGIALSFFSAAIAAGLFLGRHPSVRAARSTGVVGPAVLILVAIVWSGAAGTPARAQGDPAVAANGALVDVVDWDVIQISGGLYSTLGKPLTELSVPVGFNDIPPPVTATVEWTVQDEDGFVAVSSPTDFSVTETFTFTPRADGLCCSVDYEGVGTRTRELNGEIDVETLEADARLGDIQALAIDGEPGAFRFASDLSRPPFGEVENFLTAGDGPDECGRRVAAERSSNDLAETGGEPEIRTARRDGEVVDHVSLGPAVLLATCDLPGYSIEAAVAAAPDAPENTACPVRQDLYGALQEANTLPGVDTATTNDVFYEPNAAQCAVGALIAPPSFGQGGRGNARHELVVDFVEPLAGDWDLGYDRWFTNDRVLGMVSTFPQPAGFDRCDVDASGVPVSPGPDGRCFYETAHEIGEDLYVTISVDYSFFDGPNTIVWARTTWGTYNYRCHHCTPGDPTIATFLEGLHTYGTDWASSQYGDGEIGVAPGSQEERLAEEAAQAAAASAAAETEAGWSEEQAALAALLGMLGVSAIAITSLIESGGSMADVLDAAQGLERQEREERERAANEPPPGGIRDENNEWMVPDGDGMYDWGGVALSRADVEERILDQRRANVEREGRIRDIVRDQRSGSAAAQRFADLAEQTRAADDALRAEIRAGRQRMAEAETWAERRQAALERLELADAERIAQDEAWWSEVMDDTKAGALTDVESLRGSWQEAGTFIRDGIGTAFESTVEFLSDPESYWIMLEAGVETAWDVAGMTIGGGSFGDGAASVRAAAEPFVEPARIILETGIETAWDVAGMTIGGGQFGDGTQSVIGGVEYVAEDPIGFVVAVTPLSSFERAIDGDIPLANRLGWVGLGTIDVGLTLAGFGFGDTAVDGVRAANTARTLDSAGDVGRGASVVADAALTPELVATRNRINNALLRAQQEAAWRGVPVEQVLRDLPEARALFQGNGMQRMAALEAAGGLSDEVSAGILAIHDQITGPASLRATETAIQDMARLHGVRPQSAMVGNSGSTGFGRSVMTDADRTLATVFSDADIDKWISRNPGMSRIEAAEDMQSTFARIHQRNMELALNAPTDPAVALARSEGIELSEAVARLQAEGLDDASAAANRLTRAETDHASYGGIGSSSGQADSYGAGFTSARQSTQGSTHVFTVDEAGGVSSYATSGDALLEGLELERYRHTGQLSTVNVGGADEASRLLLHDPTRIPLSEVPSLLNQQVAAVGKYTDPKSLAKAANRANLFAGRLGGQLNNPALVRANAQILADPNSMNTVIAGLNMTQDEFMAANRAMVLEYGNRAL